MFDLPRQRDGGDARAVDGSVIIPQQRAVSTVSRGEVMEDERAIVIPVSSADPLRREFWGIVYEETLKHSRGAVDLDMINSSNAMMLLDHDPRRPCGRIERAYLKDNRLWVRATFPENGPDMCEQTWRGLASGLYRNVSVGWSADPQNVEVIENPRDDESLDFRVIYHEWSPREASIVSIPADWSVGVGRTAQFTITRTETMPEWLKKLLERYQAQLTARGQNLDEIGSQMVRDGLDEGQATAFLNGIVNALSEENRGAGEDAAERAENTNTPAAGADPAPNASQRAAESMASSEEPAAAAQPSPEPGTRSDEATATLGATRVLLDNAAVLERNGVDAAAQRALQIRAIEGRWTEAQARSAILGAMETNNPDVRHPAQPAIISERGENYSLMRAMRSLMQGRAHDETLPEVAVSHERQENWQRELGRNEMFIPISELQRDPDFMRNVQQGLVRRLQDARIAGDWMTVQRMEGMEGLGLGQHGGHRAVTVGASPSGLWVPDFNELDFIEVLVAQTGILPLTSTFPEMLYQDLNIPAETAEAGTAWTSSETAVIPVTSNPTYGNITWEWHEIHATFDISRRSRDQSITLMARLVQAVMRDIPRGIGAAMFNGSGASGIPLGIQNFSGVDVIANGTNGAAPDYEMVVDMYTELGNNNALDLGEAMYFFNAATIGTLRKTPKFTGSQGSVGMNSDTIVHSATGDMPRVDGATPVVMDNQVPNNLTKGTGTNLSFGTCCVPRELKKAYFSDMVIGIDEFTDWRNGQIRMYVRHACDFQPLHVAAFVTTVDIDNS